MNSRGSRRIRGKVAPLHRRRVQINSVYVTRELDVVFRVEFDPLWIPGFDSG